MDAISTGVVSARHGIPTRRSLHDYQSRLEFARGRRMPVTPTTHGMLVRTGTTPVLLVAPHAGRRHPERHPWSEGSIRVNDLHTGDLTMELADRLDATALVNADIDRNDIDLNRIRQVRTQAPWFLDLLCETLTDLRRRHGTATVLFIHGWNVGNPIVDVGIGSAAAKSPRENDRRPSTDPEFLSRSIGTFRQACEQQGIETGVGWRYPATNAGNLVQLFTGHHLQSADARVRQVAHVGMDANAAQLELSIPLRWPGPWRRRLVDACIRAFGRATTTRTPPQPSAPSTSPAASTGPPGRIGLQFQCADASVAGLAVFEVGSMASGRLLVLPAGEGLYLFTGEAPATKPGGELTVGPLTLSSHSSGHLTLTYEGPLLGFPDRTPFLDLETGLARAHVAEARLRLRLSPLEPARAPARSTQRPFGFSPGFTRVTGSLHVSPPSGPGPHPTLLGTSPSPIVGSGFIEDRSAALREGTRAIATIPGHPEGALRLLWRQGQAPRVHLGDDLSVFDLAPDAIQIRGDLSEDGAPLVELPAPWSGTPGATLRTTRDRAVPIIRQGVDGRVIRYLLAFCEFESAGHPAGAGWVEVSS
jgi:hypothetical protein